MAKKIYALTQRKNQVSFTLTGKGGDTVRYNFTQGNAAVGTPARLVLKNEYYQRLLEESDLYKSGMIRLERVMNEKDGNGIAADGGKPKKKVVDEVKTAADAIEYVANFFGVAAKTKNEAKRIAEENNVEFPNLK